MKSKFLTKKFISVLMAIILVISVLSASFSVFAEDAAASDVYLVNEGRFIDEIEIYNSNYKISLIKDVSPDGDAFGLSSATNVGGGVVKFQLPNVDLEKAKSMPTFACWIKVPYGNDYNFVPNFNTEAFRFNGTITAYDTLRYTVATATGTDGIVLPAGFEGYVFLDLTTCKIQNTWNADDYTATWSDFLDENGLTSLALWVMHTYVYDRNVIFDSFAFVTENYVKNIATTYSPATKLVIKDGIYRTGDYQSGNGLLATYGVKDILDSKYVCKVELEPLATNSWKWLPLNNCNFAKEGFDITNAKTFSFFAKTPDDITDFKLSLRKNGNSTYLKDFTYYLVDIKEGTVSEALKPNALQGMDFPAGFEGYVIVDLSAATGSDDNAFFSTDLKQIYLNNLYSVAQSGMIWYYSDVVLWAETADKVIDRYYTPEPIPEVLVVDDGTSGNFYDYLYGMIEGTDYTRTANDNASPDGNCITYTFKGENKMTVIGFPAFASPDMSTIKAKKAAVMWVDFESTELSSATVFLRYNGVLKNGAALCLDTIYTNITTVNTNTGKISTASNTKNLVLENGFRGYVIIDLENAMIGINGNSTGTEKLFDYMDTKALTQLSLAINAGWIKYSTISFDNLAYISDTDEFINQMSQALPLGDANEDGNTDVLDLVRMKKFLANQTPDINYYRANIVSGDTVIDALDLTDLRKLLLKDTEASEDEIKVGMALYHSVIGDWDAKYSTTYGSESSFINYYRVSSMREADAVKKANGMCWIWVNDGLFFDAETGEWLVSYEEEFKTMVQNYKDAGLWDVIAGFETEEATSRISQEQYIKLTKFISELCPEKRILACTSPWEITGYKSEDGTIDIEPLTKEALQYVTDIGYDEYHRTDEEYHRELLAKMKAVAPDDARIWFFPCTNRLSTASHWYTDEEHMLASLNVTYKLLLEQENPGGLYLYSWDTYIEGAEGLDQLLDPNGEYNFSELGNRIVEIGREILAGENAQ